MKTLCLTILILFSIQSFSQKNNDVKVLINEKVLGKNLLTSSEINGLEYVFPNRIHKTYLDTTSGFLTVQLRGLSKNDKWLKNKGYILLYDLNEKKLKWNKKVNFQTSYLQQFNNTMIFTVANKSYLLDINTGNELWEVKNNIVFADPDYNIGIGYRFNGSTGYSNKLQGLDMKNGKIIWEKELNSEYGWNDLFYTNDSTLMIVAAGLHSINIKNGKGWDYETITGKKDYTETIATNVAGAALGILTGTFVTATGHNLVHDAVSNVIIDSLYIYFSSAEQLAKINKNSGEVIWKYSFPKKFASKSTIFVEDSLIYMINNGYAFMGYRELNFGKPFIAAFDKETGKQKYLSTIN
ncbi:MAG: PQQ-binding-like beta-propeller repeat protein, partial [Chlorobi bacterium]|nr:PQQ-binding-like beta-propeller repeat protein [Chlorobiota bacterium]